MEKRSSESVRHGISQSNRENAVVPLILNAGYVEVALYGIVPEEIVLERPHAVLRKTGFERFTD